MTSDPHSQRTGTAGAVHMEHDMKKNTKRSVLAGIAVLAAGASIAGGASVTAASIDTAEPVPADATIVVQQVAQDAKGDWYSCEISLDDASWGVAPAVSGATESGTGVAIEVSAAAPGDVTGAEGQPIPVADISGGITGEAVAVAGDGNVSAGGDIVTAVELPGPDDIRPGTAEECAALQG